MNIKIPHHQLVHQIQHSGKEASSLRQLIKRLETLLPKRLQGIRAECHGKGSAATRHALVDARYHAYIEEYLSLLEQGLRQRITYETSVMLYQARQSLRRSPPSRFP